MRAKFLRYQFILSFLILLFFSQNATSQYCSPVTTNGATFGVFISKVQLDSINDSTGASASPYYTYDSTKKTTLYKSQTYTIKLRGGTYNGAINNLAVFIDFNGDQDYYDPGEQIGIIAPIGTGATQYSINFKVPCTATTGKTRMRVRMAIQTSGLLLANMDPCGTYGWGEAQDYRINIADNPMKVSSVTTAQPNLLNIVKGNLAQDVLQIKVYNPGCLDTLSINHFYINNNGSTDTADISLNSIYYTRNSNLFNTGNLFGSTTSKGHFSISGKQFMLPDTNYFWLTNDISGTANSGNLIDAGLDSITARGQTFQPIISAPNGDRLIDSAMTISSVNIWQEDTTPVSKNSFTNYIMKIEVNMSNAGGSIPIQSFTFNTTGSNNPSVNIAKAKLYYSGGISYFDTSLLLGFKTSPNGSFTINGPVYLTPGSNYFWFTYDINNGAITDDTVDVQLTSFNLNGNTQNIGGKISGYRTIIGNYCYPVQPSCGTSYIQGFDIGYIQNNSSGCTNFNGNSYSIYPSNFYTTNLNKGNTYKVTAYNSGVAQTISMWIDLNHNGVYENSEFTSLTKAGNPNLAANDTATANVLIPCGSKNGWTMIRVRSRGAGGSNGGLDACTQFGSGETEDYIVYITNQPVSNIETYTVSTADVLKGWTNQHIIKVGIVANTCSGNQTLTKLTFKTTGTTDTLDIKNAKVYFTGNIRTFNTTNLLGSYSKPGVTINVICNQNLVADTNWIWLVYDIDTAATNGHFLDGEFENAIISGKSFSPITAAPMGNRKINGYMTMNSINVTHPTVSSALVGVANQVILRIAVNMSTGASAPLNKLRLNTNGTNAPNTDIINARIWSTGGDNTFTNPVQFSTTIGAPNGVMNFVGNNGLIPGDNYFWLTYDVLANAVPNDTLDAVLDSFTINNMTYAVGNGSPAGFRMIAKSYCLPTHVQTCGASPTYIHGVRINTLNNWKSGCTGITGNKYNDYPVTSFTTTLYKGNNYYLKVYNDTNSQAQTFGYWIDLNQNGSFDTTEFVLVSANLGISKIDSAMISIPCTAKNGLTKLRVRSRGAVSKLIATDACVATNSGETEDYFINISDNPETGILGTDKITCNNATLSLFAGNSYTNYLWSNGDTTSTTKVNTAGKVWVRVKNINGCFGTDTINILASFVSLNLGNDTAVCNGGAINLSTSQAYSSYKWSNGDTTQSTTIKTQGNQICTVKNSDGCSVSDTIKVTWKYASVNIGNDTTICIGKNILLDAGLHSSYKWNTGDTTQSIAVSVGGKYSVITNDIGGCTGYDTININISNPTLQLGNDISVCAGSPVILNAGTWSKYIWSNGANTQSINVNQSNRYQVTVTNQFGCSISDSINVLFNPLPVVNLGNDTVLCVGNKLNLLGGNGTKWQWNTGDTTANISISAGGIYGVRTTNINGCSASDSITVTTSSASVNLGADKVLCDGKSDTLFATSGYPIYQWSNGAATWYIVTGIAGNYWVKVTNNYGCSATDSVNISLLPLTKAGFTTQMVSNQVTFIADDTTGASYLWDFGDGNFSTKKRPVYTYQAYGNYDVSLKVTAKNGCEDIQSKMITTMNGISVTPLQSFNLKAYPNPFQSVVNISYSVLKKTDINFTVLDISGREVMTKNLGMTSGDGLVELDLNSLSNGIYLIKVSMNDEVGMVKVIKSAN